MEEIIGAEIEDEMDLRKQALSIDFPESFGNGNSGNGGGSNGGGSGGGGSDGFGGGGVKGGRSSSASSMPMTSMNTTSSIDDHLYALGGGEGGTGHPFPPGISGVESSTMITTTTISLGQGPRQGLAQGQGLGSDSSNTRARTTTTTPSSNTTNTSSSSSSTHWSSYVLNKRDMDLARLQLLNTKMRLDHLSTEEIRTITSHLLTTIPQVMALFATVSYDQAHSILCQLVAVSSVVHLKRSSTNPLYPR